jgi:hypothetical protein
MEIEPKNPPPVYAPKVVAEVILHCATHPQRDAFAGLGGKFLSAAGKFAPRLSDKVMESAAIKEQRTNQPRQAHEHGLYQASGELQERGRHPGRVFERSIYSKAARHPFLTAALAVGAGVGVAALLRTSRSETLLEKGNAVAD